MQVIAKGGGRVKHIAASSSSATLCGALAAGEHMSAKGPGMARALCAACGKAQAAKGK